MKFMLLLIGNLAWGQSQQTTSQSKNQNTVPQNSITTNAQIDNISTQIKQFRNGKPTITGQPKYINGITVSSITFSTDNSVQTSASGGIGQNNSWTGTNTFSSTTTLVTNSVLSSTITLSNLTIGTEWSLVASTHSYSAPSIYIYGLTSTVPTGCGNQYQQYKLIIDGKENAGSAGHYFVQFASGTLPDAITTDYVVTLYGESAGGGSLATAGTNAAGCWIASNQLAGPSPVDSQFYFNYDNTQTNQITASAIFANRNSGDSTANFTSGGSSCGWKPQVTGAAKFLKIVPLSSFTGDISLWLRCIP